MMLEVEIRRMAAQDVALLFPLYCAAFPDEDLAPLLQRLHAEVPDLLSLTAAQGAECLGHILFTPCAVQGADQRVALLGPIAVSPTRQRQGLGGRLIREGFARLRQMELPLVLVLGDPVYYGHFGFQPEHAILPPYTLPAAWSGAWQSVSLEGIAAPIAGPLRPPAAWLAPSLWSA